MKDENRPIQSAGLETREGNMISLGFMAVIALSFMPFAPVVFVPLLGLVVLSVLWMIVKTIWACTTLDNRMAYGPLTRDELELQAECIEDAIRAGEVRAGDEVCDGIVVGQAWVDEALNHQERTR